MRGVSLIPLAGAVLCFVFVACVGSDPSGDGKWAQAGPAQTEQASVDDWEWRHYLGDEGRSHYAPLDQINRGNVDQLQVAWTYDTGSLDGALTQIQCNPIVVGGVLFGTTSRAHVFALDAATGREKWRFDPTVYGSMSQGHNRGVVYWSGDEASDNTGGRAGDNLKEGAAGGRILAASGNDLWALDVETGKPVASFGEGGRVDLRAGLAHGQSAGDVTSPTPGVIYKDLLILGTKVGETEGAAPGDIRAYDLNTGAIRWTFHTIPQAGEAGSSSWPAEAWKTAGGANSWAGVTLDAERGLVFLPTGSATPDFWGGERPGDNLYANSLLALDAETGERRWHFQIVHHDLWDRDLPAPPNLVRFPHNGRIVDAVAQPTKDGLLFVFDRETGEPVFPIEEQPVHPSLYAEEWVSKTQPIPSAPPAFTRRGFDPSMVDGDAREKGFKEKTLASLSGFRFGENFIPPSMEGSTMYPGFDGGAEWGGAAWDPTSGLLYINANEVGAMLKLMERPKGVNPRSIYVEKCAVCHGAELQGTGVGPSLVGVGERRSLVDIYTMLAYGSGRMPSFIDIPLPIMERLTAYVVQPDNVEAALAELDARPGSDSRYVSAGYLYLRDEQGVPINAPPFGTLTAIDLAAGELRWQVPLGDYPHLREKGIVGAGTENYGGPVVTAGGLLFIAASADEKIRAFDKATGEELWEDTLPAAGYATPSTYTVGGRQFIVVAAGGGKLGTKSGSKYVAYALP